MNSTKVDARRAQLEADLRAEGASEASIAALATTETAAKMVAHEAQAVDSIFALFGQVR